MPIRCLPVPEKTGLGISTCTLTGGTRRKEGMQMAPDGGNWELLSRTEAVALCANGDPFQHRAGIDVTKHLCAAYGKWAFRIFDSSPPHGVVFLHITPPRKIVGPQEVSLFSRDKLITAYDRAEEGSRCPRVWRRNKVQPLPHGGYSGWDEIAINFCLGEL
ncbi:MAG: hypothetical protein GQ569_07700 [Methylococcaceae bacterium]|nr:hypothetical protein [Methylococcaceae bacterium]